MLKNTNVEPNKQIPKELTTWICLYSFGVIVVIISMFIPAKIITETHLLSSLVKYLVILISICLLGYLGLRYVVISLLSKINKVTIRSIENYLFQFIAAKNTSKPRNKFDVRLPFKHYLLQVPAGGLITTFLLFGFFAEMIIHIIDTTSPVTNFYYLFESNVKKAKLVDYGEEYLEDDRGNSGTKEWYGYKFIIDGESYMCWVPWIEDDYIEVQYLESDPKINRLFVERSLIGSIIHVVATFFIYIIATLAALSSESGRKLWLDGIQAFPMQNSS